MVGCGESPDAGENTTAAGRWRAVFAHGEGVFELIESTTGEVRGTLSIDSEIWLVSGLRDGASLTFQLLPSRGEDVLFQTLGLQRLPADAAAPGLRPLHASDRLAFQARMSDDGKKAQGEVTAVLGEGEAVFHMQRLP